MKQIRLGWLHFTCLELLSFGFIRLNSKNLTYLGIRLKATVICGPLWSNSLGELVNLKQTGSVEDYEQQFQALLARVTTVQPNQQVDLFTAGLSEGLRVDVELQNPPNLITAMSLARAFERRHQGGTTRSSRRISSAWSVQRSGSSAAPASSRMTKSPHGAATSSIGSTPAPFFKRLTRSEIPECHAKGLCFNCDEPYSFGHQCKRLFWLEVEDWPGIGVEEQTEDKEPKISLHAISGKHHSHTMQLLA